MENSIEHRINQAVASLMQNEALMEDLETEAASALLDWGSQQIHYIIAETGELDDASAEEMMYPRMRALRQMMRQVNNLASGRADPDPVIRAGILDQLVDSATLVYGPQYVPPDQNRRTEFLETPITGSKQCIDFLRDWLEAKPSQQ
jgi:hypothetical protein